MKQNHTDITVILDRSGSMAHVATDTIGGFNRFLADQKAAPGTATITLHQFDHEFQTPIKAQDIQSAPELNGTTFVPRGQTALMDAIGRGIGDTGARMESAPDSERAAKVVFVIITDGHENASHEFSAQKVNEMIDHQKTKYSWEFVFLGANQDAIKTASSYGIPVANAITYAHNPQGHAAAFKSVASNLSSFRSGATRTMAFSADDVKLQAEAGVK